MFAGDTGEGIKGGKKAHFKRVQSFNPELIPSGIPAGCSRQGTGGES